MTNESIEEAGSETQPLGIFCLEGEWTSDLRSRSSIRPLLGYLRCNDKIKLIYRDVASRSEFVNYVRRWGAPRYRGYSLGYFAMHGEPGALNLEGKSISLRELGEELQGRCEGKVIYFGSCSVLHTSAKILQSFRRVTGAKALCGYTHDAYWMPSGVFDILFFHIFSCYMDVRETAKCMSKACPGIKRQIGFRVID